jgi:hypothetical protein
VAGFFPLFEGEKPRPFLVLELAAPQSPEKDQEADREAHEHVAYEIRIIQI